jgi:hypothetical protein
MSECKFRLAEPKDAKAFANWAATNPLVEQKDLLACLKQNNPTTVFFVAEEDGIAVAFAPLYCQMALGYLGFNPTTDSEQRKRALKVLMDGAMAFAVQMGVREITTLTKDKYPVARWASTHGFVKDERQLFKLDINRVMASEA